MAVGESRSRTAGLTNRLGGVNAFASAAGAPIIESAALLDTVRSEFGIQLSSISQVFGGQDSDAVVLRAASDDGAEFAVKVSRSRGVSGLLVSDAIARTIGIGIPQPLRIRSGPGQERAEGPPLVCIQPLPKGAPSGNPRDQRAVKQHRQWPSCVVRPISALNSALRSPATGSVRRPASLSLISSPLIGLAGPARGATSELDPGYFAISQMWPAGSRKLAVRTPHGRSIGPFNSCTPRVASAAQTASTSSTSMVNWTRDPAP